MKNMHKFRIGIVFLVFSLIFTMSSLFAQERFVIDGVEKIVKPDGVENFAVIAENGGTIQVGDVFYKDLKKDSFVSVKDGVVVEADIVAGRQSDFVFGSEAVSVEADTRVIFKDGKITIVGEEGAKATFAKNDKYGLLLKNTAQEVVLGKDGKLEFDSGTFSAMDFELGDMHITGKIKEGKQTPARISVVQDGYSLDSGGSAYIKSKGLLVSAREKAVTIADKPAGENHVWWPDKDALFARGSGFSIDLKEGNPWVNVKEKDMLSFNFIGESSISLENFRDAPLKDIAFFEKREEPFIKAPLLTIKTGGTSGEGTSFEMKNGDVIFSNTRSKNYLGIDAEGIYSVGRVPIEISYKNLANPEKSRTDRFFYSGNDLELAESSSGRQLYMDENGKIVYPLSSVLDSYFKMRDINEGERLSDFYLDNTAKDFIEKKREIKIISSITGWALLSGDTEKFLEDVKTLSGHPELQSKLLSNAEFKVAKSSKPLPIEQDKIRREAIAEDRSLIPNMARYVVDEGAFSEFIEKIKEQYSLTPEEVSEAKDLNRLYRNFDSAFPEYSGKFSNTQKFSFVRAGVLDKRFGVEEDVEKNVRNAVQNYLTTASSNEPLFTTKEKGFFYNYVDEKDPKSDSWNVGDISQLFKDKTLRNINTEGVSLENKILNDIATQDGLFIFSNHGLPEKQYLGRIKISSDTGEEKFQDMTLDFDNLAKALFEKYLKTKDLSKTKIVCGSCFSSDFTYNTIDSLAQKLRATGINLAEVKMPLIISSADIGKVSLSGNIGRIGDKLKDGSFSMEDFFNVQEERLLSSRLSLFVDRLDRSNAGKCAKDSSVLCQSF